MTCLREDEIKANLKESKGWKRTGKEITKTYSFQNFNESIQFVNQVARLAEEADHHPDILIKYDKVMLTLSTHDESGLTKRDFKLASKIDTLR